MGTTCPPPPAKAVSLHPRRPGLPSGWEDTPGRRGLPRPAGGRLPEPPPPASSAECRVHHGAPSNRQPRSSPPSCSPPHLQPASSWGTRGPKPQASGPAVPQLAGERLPESQQCHRPTVLRKPTWSSSSARQGHAPPQGQDSCICSGSLHNNPSPTLSG